MKHWRITQNVPRADRHQKVTTYRRVRLFGGKDVRRSRPCQSLINGGGTDKTRCAQKMWGNFVGLSRDSRVTITFDGAVYIYCAYRAVLYVIFVYAFVTVT